MLAIYLVLRLVLRLRKARNDSIMRTSSTLAVSANSNFRLVALVKTRESRWRRSVRPVDVVILRIIISSTYFILSYLLEILIAQ
jgi:hypothetical protein